MKVAIIHDWLVSQRGGENVLDAICEMFPRADLYTLIYVPGQVSGNIARLNRHVSVLQKLPSARERYRHLLPLMPWAIERFDMSPYDLILSSSHCVAKGVRKRADAYHMSYIHAPMRYMWDRFDEYFAPGRYSPLTRMAARALRPWLRNWDLRSAGRVDHFLANSKFIAARIKEYYGRDADVVYPFCETEQFSVSRKPGRFYLMVAALVPYKRVDLAIEAFNRMKKPLLVVGDGPDRARLEKLARQEGAENVEFLSGIRGLSLADMYAKCKALVFPGIEDFGIVPIEAMSAGAPVIAFGSGGALETVTSETGVFFDEATVDGLIAAVRKFEEKSGKQGFDSEACRARGRQFNRARFQREFWAALKAHVPARIWSSAETAGIALGLEPASPEAGSIARNPRP
ncbi:MAG: glycosyltransferase [Deltaproteobacteria bacterium]|nr:glycosyltransferase [Deltaproteobacteria bacterium]